MGADRRASGPDGNVTRICVADRKHAAVTTLDLPAARVQQVLDLLVTSGVSAK